MNIDGKCDTEIQTCIGLAIKCIPKRKKKQPLWNKHFVGNYIAVNAEQSLHRWWENERHQKGCSTKNTENSIEGVSKQEGNFTTISIKVTLIQRI